MNVSESPTPRFPAEVTAGVITHMNADHAEDTLLICRTLGQRPGATTAEMVDLDVDGADYRVDTGTGEEIVRIPWSRRIGERAEIRAEVVRLYEEACGAAGITPRPH